MLYPSALWTSMEMTAVDLVHCFALVVIPVHWMPGDQPLPSMPTQLIMDVDSLPLGLGLYPITSGFFMFTPCVKGPFVQGLWCQIFSPGQTIFVCRFVHLAAWCKSLHNVWILPRSAHIQTFWPPSPGPWLKGVLFLNPASHWLIFFLFLFWGKMPPQRKYALPPHHRQLFLGGNTLQSVGYAAIPPAHLEFHVWQNILVPFACYSHVVLFMGFFVHHQTTENTEIVVKSIQCIQTFLGAKPFWQTPFPNMQRLVVQMYTDLDRHIGGKHKFCVRPSECFIFQPCGFLSLNPAPGLSKIGKPRDFHSFFQPWKLFVGFNIFEAGCSMNNLFWTGLPTPIWFCPGFAQQANGSSLRDNAILWLVAHAHWQQCFEYLGPHSYTKPVCFVGLVGLLANCQILAVFARLAFLAVA